MRCFVAFDISDEVKDFVYDLQRKLSGGRLAKVKWVVKKNLHVSMKFLGEVPEKKVEEIRKVLSSVKFSKFKLKLTKLGFFPDDKKPRVIWIGLEPEAKAIELEREIDEALLNVFPSDQDFKAHLTIGRVKFMKKRVDFLKHLKEAKIERISFEVKGFKLMKSKLKREGPTYSVVENYEF